MHKKIRFSSAAAVLVISSTLIFGLNVKYRESDIVNIAEHFYIEDSFIKSTEKIIDLSVLRNNLCLLTVESISCFDFNDYNYISVKNKFSDKSRFVVKKNKEGEYLFVRDDNTIYYIPLDRDNLTFVYNSNGDSIKRTSKIIKHKFDEPLIDFHIQRGYPPRADYYTLCHFEYHDWRKKIYFDCNLHKVGFQVYPSAKLSGYGKKIRNAKINAYINRPSGYGRSLDMKFIDFDEYGFCTVHPATKKMYCYEYHGPGGRNYVSKEDFWKQKTYISDSLDIDCTYLDSWGLCKENDKYKAMIAAFNPPRIKSIEQLEINYLNALPWKVPQNYFSCVRSPEFVQCWFSRLDSYYSKENTNSIYTRKMREGYKYDRNAQKQFNAGRIKNRIIEKNNKPLKIALSFNDPTVCVLYSEGVKCFRYADYDTINKSTNKDYHRYYSFAGKQALQVFPEIIKPKIGDFSEINESCAIINNKPWCWGIPNGGISEHRFVNPKNLTMDRRSACVLDEGSIKCWGVTPEDFPASEYLTKNMPKLKNVEKFAFFGEALMCALRADNILRCWTRINVDPMTFFFPINKRIIRQVKYLNDVEYMSNFWGQGVYIQNGVKKCLRSGFESMGHVDAISTWNEENCNEYSWKNYSTQKLKQEEENYQKRYREGLKKAYQKKVEALEKL